MSGEAWTVTVALVISAFVIGMMWGLNMGVA